MGVHQFKELIVWQKAKMVCVQLYRLLEQYDLSHSILFKQILRSALSIPSNIAEGCGGSSDKQLAHFLDIAMGSSNELETQLIIFQEIAIINTDELSFLIQNVHEVQRLIAGFKKKLIKN